MKRMYPATRPIEIPTPKPQKPNKVLKKPISKITSNSHEPKQAPKNHTPLAPFSQSPRPLRSHLPTSKLIKQITDNANLIK